MKTCFFIGHRDAGQETADALLTEVERHVVEYGVTEFIVGSYGNFDRLAAEAVIKTKTVHPEITLSLLTPYHPSERRLKKPIGFDAVYYPPGMERVPLRLAIIRANRYMVEHTDYLIAYVWQTASNARELIEYALRQQSKGSMIKVTNLVNSI